MTKEIKRNIWSKFCRQFSMTNQYRQTNILVCHKENKGKVKTTTYPLLGMSLLKKGRLIDGIRFCSGSWDSDRMTEPVAELKSPNKMILEQDKNGRDKRLTIETKDKARVCIEMQGDRDNDQYYNYIEKIAYSLYERRGYDRGNDQGDWYEAEKRVKETEATFA